MIDLTGFLKDDNKKIAFKEGEMNMGKKKEKRRVIMIFSLLEKAENISDDKIRTDIGRSPKGFPFPWVKDIRDIVVVEA